MVYSGVYAKSNTKILIYTILTTESFIENNENTQNIVKNFQIYSHLKDHKAFYGIRTYKNTEKSGKYSHLLYIE